MFFLPLEDRAFIQPDAAPRAESRENPDGQPVCPAQRSVFHQFAGGVAVQEDVDDNHPASKTQNETDYTE